MNFKINFRETFQIVPATKIGFKKKSTFVAGTLCRVFRTILNVFSKYTHSVFQQGENICIMQFLKVIALFVQ